MTTTTTQLPLPLTGAAIPAPALPVRYYAGIGSRQTPPEVLVLIAGIAQKLARKGWILRSGGARGADRAFEIGHLAADGARTPEIFRPEDADEAALALAASVHPNWAACTPYARRLHARNGQIILGRDVAHPVPVEALVLWAPRSPEWTPERPLVAGGTGQAVRVALASGIPPRRIYNLAATEVRTWFQRWLTGASEGGAL